MGTAGPGQTPPQGGITQRAQRSIRMLSSELPPRISLEDMKGGKLDTRSEVADQLLPELLVVAQDPAITATIDPALIPLLQRAVDVPSPSNKLNIETVFAKIF